MIKIYNNGKEFLDENRAYLDENKYMSTFFYKDSEILDELSKKNYAIKAFSNGNELLGIKIEPYNLILYGKKECLDELLLFLNDNQYECDGIMCPEEIGDELIKRNYTELIGMDFMEAKTKTISSSSDVLIPTYEEMGLMYDDANNFFIECGLPDRVKKEVFMSQYKNFRVIKDNGIIVSFAKMVDSTDLDVRISFVYTKPSYRGRGYAKKIVNNIKNEIIDRGKVATLNVDKKNPISNHIYASIGFKKVFSQGVYFYKNKK